MSNFQSFAAAIAQQFDRMSQHELFHVDIEGDAVWQAYLAAFPEGTNPIFRVRTEHDGSYDRSVVRKIGNVVAINLDGTLTTLWDVQGLPEPYQTVANELSMLVRRANVIGLFRSKEHKLGYVSTTERLESGAVHVWNHFHADIARKHHSAAPAAVQGETATTVAVLRRGFEEITTDAVKDVLELIEQGTLYRGEESKANLREFQLLQNQFLALSTEQARSVFLWDNASSRVSRIRNTAMGQLLQALSAGTELEAAVRSYETIMAPANYRRPTALITPGMIQKATQTINQLGLESALERRHARLSDITINNVLWADNTAASVMQGGLTDLLMTEVKTVAPDANKAQEISIQDFIRQVLPRTTKLDAFFSNSHISNLMSLTTAVHADAGQLFKWPNSFAWSYNGNITDSIKEKVKAAGGNINAKLRVSLAWNNYDDLDLHCMCPDGEVFYARPWGTGNSSVKTRILDVDMNAGGRRQSRTPVENLAWQAPKNGRYVIKVDNYVKVETQDQGFTLELAFENESYQFSFPSNQVKHLECISFELRNGQLTNVKAIAPGLRGQGLSQDVWGLKTEGWVKVDTMMHSPNYWDDLAIGNKHWFFMLEGCKNNEPVRGIYNEFLLGSLDEHRKVFEVLGNKTKAPPTDQQLSGLGFSSTQRNSLLVRASDATSTRIYKINF